MIDDKDWSQELKLLVSSGYCYQSAVTNRITVGNFEITPSECNLCVVVQWQQ
jgi:hypothetical protein